MCSDVEAVPAKRSEGADAFSLMWAIRSRQFDDQDRARYIEQIRKILRTSGTHNIALFGAGNLGQAIASSSVFGDHGFQISAIFDVSPERVGKKVGDLTIRHYDEFAEIAAREGIMVGVLAVPGEVAQQVADDLVAAGVKIIFNYSDALLSVPSDVTVHTSSPAVELLYALYFYLS